MTSISTTADTAGMLGAIADLPDHLEAGHRETIDIAPAVLEAWRRVHGERPPRSVVVCGMGGSGIGADLIPAVFDTTCPVIAVKGYDLPSWVSEHDAVICVSYSGGTEETLSCYDQAATHGTRVAVLTTGGELASRAADDSVPHLPIPAGFQPRAAVGLLFSTLATALEALLVLEGAGIACADAAAAARRMVEQHDAWATTGTGTAPATTLAGELAGAIPIMYGAGPTVVVAQRWKAQINENSKLPAWCNEYPELDHNEIVGWEGADTTGGRFAVIELATAELGERMELRMDTTRDLVAPDAEHTLRLTATETSRAGQLFELITLGDYLSVALALARNVDPTPVDRIQSLKQRLADG